VILRYRLQITDYRLHFADSMAHTYEGGSIKDRENNYGYVFSGSKQFSLYCMREFTVSVGKVIHDGHI
jgi:hypothetical protein